VAVSKEIQYNFDFLALQILLSRLRLTVRQHPDPETISRCAAELRDLFIKTIHLPKVQKDLEKLKQQGGPA
jgi:hypothetical protein